MDLGYKLVNKIPIKRKQKNIAHCIHKSMNISHFCQNKLNSSPRQTVDKLPKKYLHDKIPILFRKANELAKNIRR